MKYGDNRDEALKTDGDLRHKEKYNKHIYQTVSAFTRFFPERGTVLDVGTRGGYGVEALAEQGYTAVGLELIQEYADYAASLGRNVSQGDILNYDAPDGSFDYIFGRHCVEHCSDTDAFFRECVRLLVPNGGIFLTFPLETNKLWKGRRDHYHLSHWGGKDEFRPYPRRARFKEVFFGKSKSQGIKPNGREVCYVGTKEG